MLTSRESEATLASKGIRKRGIDTALALKRSIGKLDKKIFPRAPASIQVSHRESKGRYFATYRSIPSDLYTIFAANLDAKFGEEEDGILLFVEKDGILKLADDTRDVSLESVIASMAAHEVRHRVQKHLKPGLFEPALVREFNLDLLANVRFVAGLLFLEMKERYVMEKQSGGYIKARINRIEFDATVVQIMALQIFHRSHSLEELVPLLYAGVSIRT